MFRPIIVAAVTAAFLSSAAIAETKNEPAEPAKEKTICRKAVATGSIMSKRVCKTKAEWDAIEAASREDLQRTLDQERSKSMTGTMR